MKLFMILLGCKPSGRLTEQHDIFFGVGDTLEQLVPAMKESWKNSGQLHIDAWREVTMVDGFQVQVQPRPAGATKSGNLFFINLGGYKPMEFEEYHYKMLAVAGTIQEAAKQAKKTAFFKHTGFDGAVAHIDDRYGIDVDDMVNVTDLLATQYKNEFMLEITPAERTIEDEWHLGYLSLEKVSG